MLREAAAMNARFVLRCAAVAKRRLALSWFTHAHSLVQWKLMDCIWAGHVSWTLGPSALHKMLLRQKWEWSVRGIIAFDMLNISWLIPVHCGFSGIGRSSQRCCLGFGSLNFSVSSQFCSCYFLADYCLFYLCEKLSLGLAAFKWICAFYQWA